MDDEKPGNRVAFMGVSRYGSRSSVICVSCHCLPFGYRGLGIRLRDGSVQLCSEDIKLNLTFVRLLRDKKGKC